MDTIECIYKRRSIRKYTDREVDKDIIITLLKAATAAPTACNRQPWDFIVVTEKEVLSEIKSKLYAGQYNAPAAIVVCGNMDLAFPGPGKDFWIQDCSAAIENMLLAATSLGLGTVWIGLHPIPSNAKPLYKLLDIPEEVIPLGIVYVGYPAEEKEPRTQYDEKRIYWQKYEARKHRARKKNLKYL